MWAPLIIHSEKFAEGEHRMFFSVMAMIWWGRIHVYVVFFPSSCLQQDFARHGVQNAEERQKLLKLIKSISGGTDQSYGGIDPLMPPSYGSGRSNSVGGGRGGGGGGGLTSPELRGEISGGILDLHSIDDVELLSEVSHLCVKKP
jgi:hypothetical protein